MPRFRQGDAVKYYGEYIHRIDSVNGDHAVIISEYYGITVPLTNLEKMPRRINVPSRRLFRKKNNQYMVERYPCLNQHPDIPYHDLIQIYYKTDNIVPLNHKGRPRDHNPESREYIEVFDGVMTYYNAFKPINIKTPRWELVFNTLHTGVELRKGRTEDVLHDIVLWKLQNE